MTTATKLPPATAEFKKEVHKSVLAIIGYMCVHLLLVVAAGFLVLLSVYGAIGILSFSVSFLTALAALGLFGTGLMVFIFVIKFLFSSTTEYPNDAVEITTTDHPRLFQMIHEVAAAVGTSRPKKLLLSPDVNAAVFYNSSFWSMFLPVRKNLKIGLGLVNSVNASELKAVIAHEFGHFSQRSMKVGSWVYQVNKVIHNMLYKNNSYNDALQAVGNVHGVLSIFAALTAVIVNNIQWVLREMFGVVNKTYYGLSRQMEFDADLVAAGLCGSNNIIHSLRRVEYGEVAYQSTITLCNKVLNDKKRLANFYAVHSATLTDISGLNKLETVNGLPIISSGRKQEVVNRVNFKDQWASHPTVQERNDFLQPYNLTQATDDESAWIYFNDPERWQEQLTQIIYAHVPKEEAAQHLTTEESVRMIESDWRRYALPDVFAGYYNSREIAVFDVEAIAAKPFTHKSWSVFFDNNVASAPKRLAALDEDRQVLQAIMDKHIDSKSFDFDGQKYAAKKAKEILAILDGEREQLLSQIQTTDEDLFQYCCSISPETEAEALKKAYSRYFSLRKERDDLLAGLDSMLNPLAPIFRGETLQWETIEQLILRVKNGPEQAFKQALIYWKEKGAFTENALLESADKFCNSSYAYIYNREFLEHELLHLNELANSSYNAVCDYVFDAFREIAVKQAAVVEQHEPQMALAEQSVA